MQRSSVISLIFLLLLSVPLFAQTPEEERARKAAEILTRVLERSETEEVQEAERAYAYSRNTMVLFYNDDGKVKKQTEREYEVYPDGEEQVMKLLKENGKPVENEEQLRQNKYSRTGEQAKRLTFDGELIQRYNFSYEGEETVAGRTLAVLSFVPKTNPPEDGGMFARLLNELAGKIWVDLEDDQLARLEVKLLKRVNFFGGLAGAVDKMDMRLVRERVAPGVWLNGSTQIELEGRKVFSAMRFKAFENCTAFRLAKEVAQNSPR